MDVTIKTNRIGLIKFMMPIFVVATLFFVWMIAKYIIDYEAVKDETFALIASICLEGVFVVGFLGLKFVNCKTYQFTTDKISVFRRKKLIKQYDIATVICLKYNRFRFAYIFAMMGGGMLDGGCWKLYAYLSNGSRTSLGIFSLKDVEKLKDVYGELFQIVDPTNM